MYTEEARRMRHHGATQQLYKLWKQYGDGERSARSLLSAGVTSSAREATITGLTVELCFNCCDGCIIMLRVKYKNLITYPLRYLFIDSNSAPDMIN